MSAFPRFIRAILSTNLDNFKLNIFQADSRGYHDNIWHVLVEISMFKSPFFFDKFTFDSFMASFWLCFVLSEKHPSWLCFGLVLTTLRPFLLYNRPHFDFLRPKVGRDKRNNHPRQYLNGNTFEVVVIVDTDFLILRAEAWGLRPLCLMQSRGEHALDYFGLMLTGTHTAVDLQNLRVKYDVTQCGVVFWNNKQKNWVPLPPAAQNIPGITRTGLHVCFGMRTPNSILQGQMTSVFLHFASILIEYAGDQSQY